MKKRSIKSKIIAILPAYNAESTVVAFIKSLPKHMFDEIILSDDCSRDKTYVIAKRIRGITVYKTPHNGGYGGNVKFCLSKALAHGADIILELHPDYEYDVDGVVPAITAVHHGAYLVLGNRFSQGKPVGMYWSKYIFSTILTYVDSLLLGVRIPDMHQGFRVYTKHLLKQVNFMANHDDYIFSFEIIMQTLFFHFRVVSVPVTASYHGKKRGARWAASSKYVMDTFGVLGEMFLARLGFPNARFTSVERI